MQRSCPTLNRVNCAEEQYDQEYDDAQGNPAEQLQASLRKQYQEYDRQWQRIVWTDEIAVRIWTKDGRLRIWINPKNKIGTNMFERGNGGGFLVWAAIWMNGHLEIKII